jgi:23S rRNA (pseudouridine1915-N3)-methyltransferase
VRLVVAAVGRPRDRALADAIAEYERRASRYWPLTIIEVREEPGRGRTPAQVIDTEGDRLLARLPTPSLVVACDPGGKSMTSDAFASWLTERRDRGESVAFVIGGAHGLSSVVRERASVRLSLAPWTLPHELARLVLAEQLYRAGTIARGEPYHK